MDTGKIEEIRSGGLNGSKDCIDPGLISGGLFFNVMITK